MEVITEKGKKVKFLNKNGYDRDTINAREKGLIEGEIYTVKSMDVGRSSSKVFLEGFEEGFNTVMFENVGEVGNFNWFSLSYRNDPYKPHHWKGKE